MFDVFAAGADVVRPVRSLGQAERLQSLSHLPLSPERQALSRSVFAYEIELGGNKLSQAQQAFPG